MPRVIADRILAWILIIKIDQSNKIERTDKSTFIALANGSSRILEVPAGVKRSILALIKVRSPRVETAVYLFGIVVYVLIAPLLKSRVIVERFLIDTEYTGHEQLIKSILLRLARKQNYQLTNEQIIFGQVGRNANAHKLAYGAYRGDIGVDEVVTEQQIAVHL